MHAIITRSLYILYPIFEKYFFVFKEVSLENYVLMYVCVVANVESGLELSQLNSSPQVWV